MKVLIWLREGLWEVAVDTALRVSGSDAEMVLLHVTSPEVEEVIRGGMAGLLGRHRTAPTRVADVGPAAQRELFAAARRRLGRDCVELTRRGRIEREVIEAAADADLLVVSRDGDRARLGPHSLGPATRFVVDHAPCPVLLVWPGTAPGLSSIPPLPPGDRPPPPPR
ncbi:MAG: universal stress protein [Nakamurella sp.]